jgi:CelD/BcsL family acetyltransferase involved in cellulose biosynthesis
MGGTNEAVGERISAEAFEACCDEFDACVAAEPDIDPFCSRSEWILPYHRAFLPDRELYLYRGGAGGRSFVTLASRSHETVGPYLESLENMWCFACPLIGPGAVALLERAIADCAAAAGARRGRVPVVLSGLADLRNRHSLLGRVVASLADRFDVHAVDETTRYVASLEGGFDGWLSRRRRSFRKGLRAAVRRASGEGLVFEHLQVAGAREARALYPRILAIEARSWKAAEGSGADTGSLRAFYEDMLPRLAARGGLRVLVVQRDGRDLGYLHGALTGDHFRGLQMSYDRDYEHLSLGNLLQREMLLRLCEEGVAHYDLGTRSGYKRRWAEDGLRTITILARPR